MSPVLHPFYSLVPPCPWMKKVLKGKLFADVEGLKQKTAEALQGIKIYKFRNCFEQWRNHLDRCIASNGEHFEGD